VADIALSNGTVEVVFDSEHGRITSLRHRRLGVELVQERRLAESFRILVPLPEWRGHYLRGSSQALRSGHVADDRRSATLQWAGLESPAGRFDITVRMTVVLDGDQVQFRTEVDNRTDLTVEEVLCPALGGLRADEEAPAWRIHHSNWVGVGHEWNVYEELPGSYLGPDEPVWQAMYPNGMSMPWVDIYHADRRVGAMIADLNPSPAGAISAFRAQLSPATTYRGARQWWPTRREAGETPVGLTVGWSRFPFVDPGRSWQSPPVVVRFHEGTWWEAARIYRRWFDATMPYPATRPRSWLNGQDGWQSTIMSYPEGTVTARFSDIPRLAAAARSAGINVLQLDGWDVGGIDRDYPEYRPDPRLGTADELRSALQRAREMGVRVLLFANLQWASIETDWYRDELHEYAVKDPRGFARNSMGWEYHTSLGLAGQCESRMVLMDPGRPGFNRIIREQLEGVVGLGPDGIQIDKLGAGFAIDYAAGPGAGRDASVATGVWDVVRALYEANQGRGGGLGLAGETHWDRTMPFIDASYARFFSEEHLPTTAVAFPEFRQTSCIPGRYERAMVNNCLRYGHIVNVEARYLHGSADDIPELAPYVRAVLELRRNLRPVLWDSELVEPGVADVKVDSDDGLLSAVHRSREKPGAGAAVLNHFERDAKSAELRIDGGHRDAVLWRPGEAPTAIQLPAKVDVGPDEVVVATWE